MSSKPLQLDMGRVDHDSDHEPASDLSPDIDLLWNRLDKALDRITALESQLSALRIDLDRTARAAARLLSPLYRALQPVFGDAEAITGIEAASPAPASASPLGAAKSAVWDSWKSKLGLSAAKVIDALLTHRELNTQQLAIAVGLHRTTIPAIIYKLNQAGLINKQGGRFSLKQL